jgi:hypothetical protein
MSDPLSSLFLSVAAVAIVAMFLLANPNQPEQPSVTIAACQDSCTKSGHTSVTLRFSDKEDTDPEGTAASQKRGLERITIEPDGTIECVCKTD